MQKSYYIDSTIRFHKFRLPYAPFGFQESERVVEIPWSLSCLESDEKILDVGYANAEPRYINELCNLPLKEIHGYDMVDNNTISDKIIKARGDVREALPYPQEYFDSILCISTIEHVGFDNSIYFTDSCYTKRLNDDLIVVENLLKTLRKKGKLIITLPFGKLVDYGWFVQYDSQRLHRLITYSNCYVGGLDYFLYMNHGWNEAREEDLRDVEYKGNNSPAATGLACLLLFKK